MRSFANLKYPQKGEQPKTKRLQYEPRLATEPNEVKTARSSAYDKEFQDTWSRRLSFCDQPSFKKQEKGLQRKYEQTKKYLRNRQDNSKEEKAAELSKQFKATLQDLQLARAQMKKYQQDIKQNRDIQEQLQSMTKALMEEFNKEMEKKDAVSRMIKMGEVQYQRVCQLKDSAKEEYQQAEKLKDQTKRQWQQYKKARDSLSAECKQLKATKTQIMRAINQKGGIVAENRSLVEALKCSENLCSKLQEEKKKLKDQQLRSLINSDEVVQKLDAEIQKLKKQIASKDEKLKLKDDSIRRSSKFLQDRVRELRSEIEAKDQQIRQLKLRIQLSAQQAQIKLLDLQKAESIQQVMQDKSVASKISESAYLKKLDIYQPQTQISSLKSAFHDLQSRLSKVSAINRALSKQNKALIKVNTDLNEQFAKMSEGMLSYDEQHSLIKDIELLGEEVTLRKSDMLLVDWDSSLERAAEQHAQNKAIQNELRDVDRTSLSCFLRRQVTASVQSQP